MPLSGLAVASAISFVTVGFPSPVDPRSFIAFGQHYSVNWVQWNHSPLDPFTSWDIIIREQFGNIQSVREAAVKHPELVSRHVASNLRRAGGSLADLYAWSPGSARFQWVIFWCVFLVGLASWKLKSRLSDYARNLTNHLAWVVVCFFPPMFSTALIYPREHYLLFLVFALPIAVAAVVRCERPIPFKTQIGLIALSGALLLINHPDLSNWFGTGQPRPELQRVTALRKLHILGDVRMLEGEGSLSAYLGDQYSFVVPGEIPGDVLSFLNARKINLIVLTDRLASDVHYANDPTFIELNRNPQRLGFHERFVPGMIGKVLEADSVMDLDLRK
jgi:hypothetical protein